MKNLLKIFLTLLLLPSFAAHRLDAYTLQRALEISITIGVPVSIVEESPLKFPDTLALGVPQNIVAQPSDPEAASFSISGKPESTIVASIVEPSLSMSIASSTIIVDQFTFGGSANPDGTALLNKQGKLTGLTVGATANIPANPAAGVYSGTLTLRVVYN